MTPLGALKVGAAIRARREEGDEWEEATILRAELLPAPQPAGATIRLRFSGGYSAEVPVGRVQLLSVAEGEAPAPDDGYLEAVEELLPAPPTAEALAQDEEAKYAYVAQYKAVGNELFKRQQYEWAIRTYTEAVAALAKGCYASRERMLWDYLARTPCAQCYSNASLCALKLGEHVRALALLDQADPLSPPLFLLPSFFSLLSSPFFIPLSFCSLLSSPFFLLPSFFLSFPFCLLTSFFSLLSAPFWCACLLPLRSARRPRRPFLSFFHPF